MATSVIQQAHVTTDQDGQRYTILYLATVGKADGPDRMEPVIAHSYRTADGDPVELRNNCFVIHKGDSEIVTTTSDEWQ